MASSWHLVKSQRIDHCSLTNNAHTFRVLNDSWVGTLHQRNSRVGGTQVDTDDRALNLLAILALDVLRIPSPELC